METEQAMESAEKLHNEQAARLGAEPDDHGRVALVTGASGGIGLALVTGLLAQPGIGRVYAGCRKPDYCAALREIAEEDPRLRPLQIDVTDAPSIARAVAVMAESERLDIAINTAGILHSVAGMRPEKRLSEINTDDLLLAYDVNALGAMRLAVAIEPLLNNSASPRFISLSARVGSIEDNQLGGWYAYRASKAALNMLLKTLAIEWSRLQPKIVCAALHPGTVSTALSDPFTARGFKGKVFTPAQAASNLLEVIDGIEPEQSGGFFAWDGKEIPW